MFKRTHRAILARNNTFPYGTFPIAATMWNDAYERKIDPRMDVTAKRFIRRTNKKSTLTLPDDIKAALCIFISYYSERAFSLKAITIHSHSQQFYCANKVYILNKTCSQICFHSSLRLSSGRSSSSSSSIELDHPGGVFFCLVSSSSTG